MSADISKLAVIDSRIVQSRPAYAVEKGALSLTNAPFNAISATSSQHTYNIYVPSENVFCDRHVLWTSGVALRATVQIPTATVVLANQGTSVIAPGKDFALAPLPLNQLCQTISATINDTTSTINSQDVLTPVLRMTDSAPNRLCRTAPTMLDTYANYNDAYGTAANPLAGYDYATDKDRVPNGAFPGLVFTDAAGTVFPTNTYGVYAGAGVAGTNSKPANLGTGPTAYPYAVQNGVPVLPQIWQGNGAAPPVSAIAYAVGDLVTYLGISYVCVAAAAAGQALPLGNAAQWLSVGNWNTGLDLYFKFTSTEPIVDSPFVFADEQEWSSGLFGINNIQLLMNLQSSPARCVRATTQNSRTITAINYNTSISGGNPFINPQVNIQFLTPNLDVPLPPKSVVPFMEFPRFISQPVSCPAGVVTQLSSQTITLPQIPDLVFIYAKPVNYNVTGGTVLDLTQADWLMPVASTQVGGTRNPLSVNFDNFSGLLSSHTTEELFAMSRHNGLDMDWATWSGQARAGASSLQAGAMVQTAGGMLVLKPSQDITLQSGQAPSLVGNFTLQFSLSVYNPGAARDVQLFVVTANSGFFETIRGSSRIIKGVLSEQDIINAPAAGMMARSQLHRMVGGQSFKSLGNVLSVAKDVYNATKPLLPEAVQRGVSVARDVAGDVGRALGSLGSGTGGGRTGGKKGKKSLEHLLM